MNDSTTLRILDAATNRASEGLRVVEDYARFVLDDGHLTGILKQLRHNLAQTCAALPHSERCAVRETRRDVGTQISTPSESSRTDAWEVCVASLERVKQSLRSLEEYGKLVGADFAQQIEVHRYQLYTVQRCLTITQTNRLRLRHTRLCVLIDAQKTLADFRELVTTLLQAGVDMIQLRDKSLCDAELVERGRELVCLVSRQNGEAMERGKPVAIINDRADVAAVVGADGVHLGQDDMSVKDARAILGPRKLIGVSTHSIEQARTAVLDGASYLGAGPTFPSTTKSFDDFPGTGLLKQIAKEIRLPTFAIGGIQESNLQQVLATGISQVAVSGAVVRTADPAQAVQELLKGWDEVPAGAGG